MKKLISLILSILLVSLCGCVKETKELTEKPQNTAEVLPEIEVEVPEETEIPVIETEGLPNEKKGWGFRPVKGQRPELTKTQISEMEKYGCVYLGNENEKVMYLTFDEGYENGYTKPILDTLRKMNVKAAFFITGSYFDKNEDLVDTMVRDGHIVGNHTVNHPSLPDKSDEDIKKETEELNNKFFEKYGLRMTYIRPPMGEYSERTLALTKNMGYINAFWSFAYKDWETNNQKGKDYAFETATSSFHNGAVILLHAVSKDNSDALEEIILKAHEMGYQFKSLDEYR